LVQLIELMLALALALALAKLHVVSSVLNHMALVCVCGAPHTPSTASARAGRFLRFIGGFGLHRASGRRSTNADKCTPNGTNPIQSKQVEVNVSKSIQGIQFISLGILNWLI
jgi:hypothetical protein